jgi:hypothetical protein
LLHQLRKFYNSRDAARARKSGLAFSRAFGRLENAAQNLGTLPAQAVTEHDLRAYY